jgi:glycosyltransferase involved in cell wall biosynthesis
MKVLHVWQDYSTSAYGGIELALSQIAKATTPFGVSSSVFHIGVNRNGDYLASAGVCEIRESRLGKIWSLAIPRWSAVNRLRHAIEDADVVHYQMPWPVADVLHLTLKPERPAVATYQADLGRHKIIEPFYAPLRSRFLQSLDRIVVTSDDFGSECVALDQVRSKVVTIPLCLEDLDAAKPSAEMSNAEPFFLFIGVLRYYKGLDVLIAAAEKAGISLVIAGDGALFEPIRHQLRVKKLNKVTLLGQVTEQEKRKLIANCRALVLPSPTRAESFGIVLLEAMRASKPVITTNIASGMRFVCLNGKTGITVPPNDPDALAEAMQTLLSNSVLALTMGRAGRKRFLSEFSPQIVGKLYYELYKQVVSDHSRKRGAGGSE